MKTADRKSNAGGVAPTPADPKTETVRDERRQLARDLAVLIRRKLRHDAAEAARRGGAESAVNPG